MADPIPYDLEGLLALLERLDGAEEVAVVRSAIDAGVPRERVLDELSREVPRRLSHPSRKTIGLRVPEHNVPAALTEELGQPLLGTSLIMPGEDGPMTDAIEIRERLEKLIDLVIDSGPASNVPTTVIDLSGDEAVLVRAGRGDPAMFGLQ